MRQQKLAAIFSCVIFIASIIAISLNGLNLGLDFTGGNQALVGFSQTSPINLDRIRQKMAASGFVQTSVSRSGLTDVSIRLGLGKHDASQKDSMSFFHFQLWPRSLWGTNNAFFRRKISRILRLSTSKLDRI